MSLQQEPTAQFLRHDGAYILRLGEDVPAYCCDASVSRVTEHAREQLHDRGPFCVTSAHARENVDGRIAPQQNLSIIPQDDYRRWQRRSHLRRNALREYLCLACREMEEARVVL